jgi:hypothetical protein
MTAKKKTVWFVDDFGQATEAVQKAYMQWLLGGELAGKQLSPEVTMIIATNGRRDKAGVSGILEPVKSRFASIVELKADLDELCIWAMTNQKASKLISPVMVAYWRNNPDSICAFKPTADMTNSPTPRTWFNAARIESLKLPSSIEHEAMAGSVGEAEAGNYLAYRAIAASLVSIDTILVDPANAPLPTKPSEAFIVSMALAYRANAQIISRIGVYCTRLAQANMGEFAALTVRDSIRRTPSLANTSEYVKLMCGPVGQLISGQTMSV